MLRRATHSWHLLYCLEKERESELYKVKLQSVSKGEKTAGESLCESVLPCVLEYLPTGKASLFVFAIDVFEIQHAKDCTLWLNGVALLPLEGINTDVLGYSSSMGAIVGLCESVYSFTRKYSSHIGDCDGYLFPG